MQMVERYLMLYGRFVETAAGTDLPYEYEVTLGQIAGALYCTERNAKLVLRRLSEEGMIEWRAGRGRGNRSQLAFLVGKEKLLLEATQQYAEKGEYNKAFQLLGEFGGHTETNERFAEWMNSRFGIRKEQAEGKDVLRLPIHQPIVTIDPAASTFSLSGHIVLQLYDRLLYYDYDSERFAPAIAHYWESSGDGRIYTFHLRKGVLFHNGKELTSEDVAFTINRLRQGKNNGWIVRSVERVEVVSPRLLRIVLDKPNYLFLRFLCSVAVSILPDAYAGLTEEEYQRNPIGTGPFQIGAWTDDRLVLHAFPQYYQGRPHLDAVEIVSLPQGGTVSGKIGKMDWNQLLGEHGKRSLLPENDWLEKERDSYCTSVMTWNMNKQGPHQSTAFRQAVDRLLDRRAMLSELGLNRARAAAGFFHDRHNPGDEIAYDPELAKELLRQSGYDGEEIVLSTYGKHGEDAEWIQQRLNEAGIRIRLVVETYDRIHGVLQTSDAILHALVFPEDEVCLIENYEQKGSFVHEYQQPEQLQWIIGRIDQALACESRRERLAVYDEIEQRLKEEAYILFLMHKKLYAYVNPAFKGANLSPNGWIDFKQIWRPDEEPA